MNSLGRQLVVEYYECDPDILNDVALIEGNMLKAAGAANATVINSTFHHFSPFGASGVVVIHESHLAIHTWPEYGYAAVDIFTCGDSVDPWVCYKFLEKAFGAGYASAMEMLRGQESQLGKSGAKNTLDPDREAPRPPIQQNRNVWFTERNENIAISLRHRGDRLFLGQSEFQKVEVYDTYAYGRLLTLDGLVMTSEGDEYAYHEMIAHVPMQLRTDARRALIIGGGDGGVARELLRYPQLEEVVMVEIDQMVVDASREYLPGIAVELDNPRLDLRIDDGINYVAEAPEAAFDLVIVDSTDPVGPGKGLFTAEFYRGVHRVLNERGIMITQSESPRYNVRVFQEIYACYRAIFGPENVHCYLGQIPTYPSGTWSFSFCSKADLHPIQDLDFAAARAFAEQHDLDYYDADVHQAAFVLPRFVRKLLAAEVTA
ncbi:MAG: polyamine aminopropyltransferase [Bacteroidota bacterium]